MKFEYVRQSTVEDWVALFTEKPEAVSQVRIINDRIARGLPLATWEQNCLKAYYHINAQQAA